MEKEELNEELQKTRRLSMAALDKTRNKVEQRRKEEIEMSIKLAEKEAKLRKLKAERSISSSRTSIDDQSLDTNTYGNNMDNNLLDDASTSHAPMSIQITQQTDEDASIQYLRQEREGKMEAIRDQIKHKDTLLEDLHNYAARQQETIQSLQQQLEMLHVDSGLDFQREVQEKETYVLGLKEELNKLHEGMTEREREHLKLEQEWDMQEDLVMDTEAEASRELASMQIKLENFTQEMQIRDGKRSDMLRTTSEAFEEMRQDLMEFLDPESVHRLISKTRRSFDSLQEKEDELASMLVERLEERNAFQPTSTSLQSAEKWCSKTSEKLSNLSSLFNAKIKQLGSTTSDVEDGSDNLSRLNSLREEIRSTFDSLLKSAEEGLDPMDDSSSGEKESIPNDTNKEQSIEKINFLIRKSFLQVFRAFPTDEPHKATLSTEDDCSIRELQNQVETKENELSNLVQDLYQMEERSKENLLRAIESFELLEKEIKFLSSGLKEKDRIISEIKRITQQRKNAEATLMKELIVIHKKGLIIKSDFDESNASLFERMENIINENDSVKEEEKIKN